jgi:hypothetical protein
MRYAFLSENSEVRQIIRGDLSPDQLAALGNDYRVIFHAVSIVEIADDALPVWIGGSYDATSGVFSPPPSPEPEPIVEETTNDDAPII